MSLPRAAGKVSLTGKVVLVGWPCGGHPQSVALTRFCPGFCGQQGGRISAAREAQGRGAGKEGQQWDSDPLSDPPGPDVPAIRTHLQQQGIRYRWGRIGPE